MSYLKHEFWPASEKARGSRSTRIIRAQLVDKFVTTHDIMIWNVSKNGIGASMDGNPPRTGSDVTLILFDAPPLLGKIRWVEDNAFGIVLEDDLSLEFMSDLIKRKHELMTPRTDWEVRRLHRIETTPVEPSAVRKV